MSKGLCCCEYIDRNGENNHILACLCNCQELDRCCNGLMTCKRVPWKLLMKFMITANDRLRLPWKGGAKKISLDSLLPTFIIPLFLICAAQSLWVSVVAFSFLPLFLIYSHFLFMKFYPLTHFFFVWNCASHLIIFGIFQEVGVPVLEIRSDENLVIILLTFAIGYCLYKVKQNEKLSFVINNPDASSDCITSNLCPECNFRPPPRAYHCHICQLCVLKRDQHCAWLSCCIGKNNHFWYIMFLILTFSQLAIYSNLILTTVCHPFKVFGPIMLPDDCSDVYYDLLYAICFVTAIYCLEGAVFVGAVLYHEFWLISLGLTGHEFRNRGPKSNYCGLLMPRPFSKGFIRNWCLFWRGNDPSLPYHYI